MNKFARMMARKVLTVFVALFCFFQMEAQNSRKMLEYDFDGALSEFRDSLEVCTDSTRINALNLAIKRAENGKVLTEYCHRPKVVARGRFHREEFFLYFPLPDGSWHETQDSSKVVFDLSGERDSISLFRRDSLELFPVVMGKEKYFAAKDLYGMGGYDLYISRWDEQTKDWGTPENLGFPYSSPYDDIMYINTSDGRFSVFASNRNCPVDSADVYVVEYEPNPIRTSVSDPSELKKIAALDPPVSSGEKEVAPKEQVEDESMNKYRGKIIFIRNLRDSLSLADKTLGNLRENYASATGEEKKRIEGELADGEMRISLLQSSLDRALVELREIETDFLLNGVVINADNFFPLQQEKEEEKELKFEFTRHKYGNPLSIKYL